MQIVRWHLAATASAEASTVAPAATSGATLAGLMSCTTSSNPALTRLSAIVPPILPSPIKPTVSVIGFLLVTAAIVARGGYRETALAQMSEGVRRPVDFALATGESAGEVRGGS